MKTGVMIGIGLFLLLAVVGSAISREVARKPLDQLWEEHMLAGTSATYSDGKHIEYVFERSFEEAMGSPSSAWDTKQGIAVVDLGERRFLSLWVGGGWTLEGGLLGKIEEGASAIELYGKRVTRVQPHFILNLRATHVPNVEFSYDFFLLHRKKGAARATVLRKWIFRPEELRRLGDAPPYDTYVQGYLRYDPTTKTATVTITGLTHPFEEYIDLSETLRN